MSLSKTRARKSDGSENKFDVKSNNVINESSSDSEYSFSEVHEAFVDVRNFEAENELPPIAVRMMNLGKELAIFCLIMITYAAFTKDPPKVSKPPAAYPFFPEGSIVSDWYRGQINAAIENARASDVTFVMYYAPWDAESQAAKREFEEVAKYYKNKYVTFAAVNCWQPNTECRQQYSKVYKWPVFIAYPSHGRGIQYNGPVSSVHMIEFLQKVYNPLVRLTSEKPVDFDDAYVVATLNTSPGSNDFIVYYLASLRYLERDPQHRITFYVNSSSNNVPHLTFYLWNETLTFPINDKPWTPEQILGWIYKNMHQVSSWVLPNAIKSMALSKSIDDEPTLILFTPRNPMQTTSDFYSLMQEISQEYYNCDEIILNPQSVSVQWKRTENLLRYSNLLLNCKLKEKSRSNNITWKLNNVWSNTSFIKGCNKLITEGNLEYPSCIILQKQFEDVSNSAVKTFQQNCEEKSTSESYETSMLKGNNDPRSSVNLVRTLQKDTCRNFLFAEKYHPADFELLVSVKGKPTNINGLACKNNKTLSFLAMDSLLHYPFAEKLGMDLTKYESRTAAVILDDKMESHYILEEPVNGHSLREFISNFTSNKLLRSSKSITTLKTKPNSLKENNKSKITNKMLLKELNSTSFLPTVMEKTKAVVVFFYSKQCAFCSGFSYSFLTLARKLRYVENIVFARIDGEENILPWEYTMEVFPTILLFPASRKSESRVFGSNVPITVTNLLGFLLTNIDPQLKIGAIWSLCLQMKTKEESSCYFSLLRETLTQIDRALRNWRKSSERQKSKHLYKLKQLRQLHMLFAHHPHNYQLITIYFENIQVKFNFTDFHKQDVAKHMKDEL